MTSLESERRVSSVPDRDPFPIILGIDPSMNSLGWAAYNFNLGEDRYNIDSKAWRFGRICPASVNRKGNELSKQAKWQDAYFKLQKALGDWKPTHLACEYPTFFGNARGKIAAMKGYTLDLAGMVGYLSGRLRMSAEQMTLWTPERWKGTVPKTVTQAKFVRLYGKSANTIVRTCSDDVVDAIMICEFWLSLYFRGKFSWQQAACLTKNQFS